MVEFTHHIPPPCTEPVDIVYVDEHVLVVSKPSGLLSVPGRFMKDCVFNRMLAQYPTATIVHRLDLDTSGLLVYSLSKLATSDLNRQFRERVIRKEYIADVYGEVVLDQGEINLPIAPDPVNRPKQLIDHEFGKSALTRYEVIKKYRRNDDELTITRLRLKPVTGRSHQLRIHSASINHPIIGCDLYAHKNALALSKRLHLHAELLGFSHPLTQEILLFEDAVPFSIDDIN